MRHPSLDDIRRWVKDRGETGDLGTHDDECWKWHADCLASLMLQHVSDLEHKAELIQDSTGSPQTP